MPQLEIPDYAPQIFWLIVTFVALLILMWAIALPRISRVLEQRQKHISGDLDQAEKLKQSAQEAMDAYENSLSDAIILHICCIYFDVNVVFENLLIIMPLVFIATVIPISFGGLGVREASLIGLLSLFTPFSSKLIIISFILTSIKLCVGVIGIPFYLQKSE